MENLIFLVDIPGFEGYYGITEEGEVYSIKSKQLLSSSLRSGYLSVVLCKDGLRKNYLIHRLIALMFIPNPDKCQQVDHIDRDKRNNSVSNLRWVSHKQNSANRVSVKNTSSQYKGVSLSNNKWEASIKINKKSIYLGRYENEIDAAIAYNNAIDRYYPNCEFHYRNEV